MNLPARRLGGQPSPKARTVHRFVRHPQTNSVVIRMYRIKHGEYFVKWNRSINEAGGNSVWRATVFQVGK
jgi:hypothetical protein